MITLAQKGLQFVVLRHTGYEEDHFDLMLEVGTASPLITYRSPRWPIAEAVQLTQLGDHRRDYLEYEGPVSGNRGQVQRVARGVYDLSGDGANLLLTFRSGTDHPPLVIDAAARARPAADFSA